MPAVAILAKHRTESLMEQLTSEWGEMKAEHQLEIDALKAETEHDYHQSKVRKEEITLKTDGKKGEILLRYQGKGLSNAELQRATGASREYVKRCLRYGRFLEFIKTGTVIITVPVMKEYGFNQLWMKQSDEPTVDQLQGKSNLNKLLAYEKLVFGDIMEMLQNGTIMLHPSGRKKRTTSKKSTSSNSAVDVKSARLFIKIKRKEVRTLYNDIRQDVEDLIALIGRDRNDKRLLSPDGLGIRAKRLKKRWEELAKALSIEDVIHDTWTDTIPD